MSYTPVSQRDNKKKSGSYTPVRQRTESKSLQSFFPATNKVRQATLNRVPEQPETREKQIQQLSERDMSQDVIKQKKPSLVDKARKFLPKPISQALFGTGREMGAGEEIIPGIQAESVQSDTGAIGFFYEALTKSDQRQYDELTQNLQNAGISEERANLIASGQAQELTPAEEKIVDRKKMVDLAFKGLEALDFMPVLGAMTKPGRTALKSSIMKRLVAENDETKVQETLNKADKVFRQNDTTQLAETIAKTSDEREAQRAIDEFVQSNRKPSYTPVRERAGKTTPLADDIPEELATEARKYDSEATTFYARRESVPKAISNEDNFVEAHRLFHGANTQFADQLEETRRFIPDAEREAGTGGNFYGLSATTDARMAQDFSTSATGEGRVVELFIDPKARVLNLKNRSIDDLSEAETRELSETFDVIRDVDNIGGESEVRILNPNILRDESAIRSAFTLEETGITDIFNRVKGGGRVADEAIPTTPKPQRPAPRVQIDAEISQIRNAIKNRELNEQAVDELSTRISIAEDAIESNPASQLMKYVSRSTGELPEVTGKEMITSPSGRGKIKNSKFGRQGDDIVKSLGFDDVEEAARALDEYRTSKEALTDLKETLRSRKGERTLANKAEAVTRAATQGRRSYVKELRNQFQLKDSDVRKAARGGDYRTMSEGSFNDFITRLEQRAVEVADTRQAKAELVDLLERRNFEKVENYRRTQGYPPVRDMTAEQLRRYTEALEQFQTGDEFLTQRQLEVVDRSELKGVKTMREARERLLEQVKKMPGMENTTLEDLQNISVSSFDNLRFDTALAEKNPYYNFVVNRTQTHMLAGEANYLEVQNKINELAKAANKSRNRGLGGSVRQAIIPKHQEIVDYLEAPMADKSAFAEKLTKEELDYANYIQQYYSDAYDHLVKIKELYGSRYVDQYFTHMRRDFLEAWSDDGFVKALREMYVSQKEDLAIANITDTDTGQILPKAKFFQYTLRRQEGGITPSKNVTHVFLQYARTFERKKMFDRMIPEIDIYSQSLTPKDLTPRKLETNRQLKTFINTYLNNKKGRRVDIARVIKQNNPGDILIRMGNTMVSLLDLGLNLLASTASVVGELIMTYQALGKLDYTKAWKRRIWDTGIKRMGDKNANKILKEAEPFIGRNIWTELAEPDKGIMDKGMKAVFGAFSQSTVEANKLFLLGRISKEEMKAGKLSAERLATLRLEAGRWRDLGRDVKSIVGSTSVGEMTTKYKGWAIPIARTSIKNITELAKGLKRGQFKDTLTSREATETYRAIEMSTVLVMVGAYVLSEEKDDTFIGQIKARIYTESLTLLGGIDPALFMSTPRLVSFLQQLAGNLRDIATLEQYQQDSRWGEKGDLKGVAGVKRQFTPAAMRQFGGSSAQSTTPGTGDVDFGFDDLSESGEIGEVDFGFDELDFGLNQ